MPFNILKKDFSVKGAGATEYRYEKWIVLILNLYKIDNPTFYQN